MLDLNKNEPVKCKITLNESFEFIFKNFSIYLKSIHDNVLKLKHKNSNEKKMISFSYNKFKHEIMNQTKTYNKQLKQIFMIIHNFIFIYEKNLKIQYKNTPPIINVNITDKIKNQSKKILKLTQKNKDLHDSIQKNNDSYISSINEFMNNNNDNNFKYLPKIIFDHLPSQSKNFKKHKYKFELKCNEYAKIGRNGWCIFIYNNSSKIVLQRSGKSSKVYNLNDLPKELHREYMYVYKIIQDIKDRLTQKNDSIYSIPQNDDSYLNNYNSDNASCSDFGDINEIVNINNNYSKNKIKTNRNKILLSCVEEKMNGHGESSFSNNDTKLSNLDLSQNTLLNNLETKYKASKCMIQYTSDNGLMVASDNGSIMTRDGKTVFVKQGSVVQSLKIEEVTDISCPNLKSSVKHKLQMGTAALTMDIHTGNIPIKK